MDRLDASAAGAVRILEADGFDLGRSGLSTESGEGVKLNLGGGTFGSVDGEIEHSGSGTFTTVSYTHLTLPTILLV